MTRIAVRPCIHNCRWNRPRWRPFCHRCGQLFGRRYGLLLRHRSQGRQAYFNRLSPHPRIQYQGARVSLSHPNTGLCWLYSHYTWAPGQGRLVRGAWSGPAWRDSKPRWGCFVKLPIARSGHPCLTRMACHLLDGIQPGQGSLVWLT